METSSEHKLLFTIIALLCVVLFWFYKPQILSFFRSVNINNKASAFRNCGETSAPDPKNPSSYLNNSVLDCFGESALRCQSAKGVLNNALFPTNFQVAKDEEGTCYFQLAYKKDSSLVDITGRKLVGQYMFCPLSIVKFVDESKANAPLFKAPDTENPGKYASQIYFYGTLGVFMENNVDKNKIRNIGCSGPYLDSVVAGYHKMQEKK